MITSRLCQGAAAEADTIRAAEADALREQQLKWMQSGSSSWNGSNQGTADRNWITAAKVDAIRAQFGLTMW